MAIGKPSISLPDANTALSLGKFSIEWKTSKLRNAASPISEQTENILCNAVQGFVRLLL